VRKWLIFFVLGWLGGWLGGCFVGCFWGFWGFSGDGISLIHRFCHTVYLYDGCDFDGRSLKYTIVFLVNLSIFAILV